MDVLKIKYCYVFKIDCIISNHFLFTYLFIYLFLKGEGKTRKKMMMNCKQKKTRKN
jgi:hypothetical protein